MATTAGSIALAENVPLEDATITKRLRDAGAVILGKAQLSEFANWMSLTRTLDVPVLSVLGDQDVLFCDPTCGEKEAERERTFWSPEACFEIEILPETGHFVQLHTEAAPAFADLALDWLDRRIGSDASSPPAEPCTGEAGG